MNELQKALDEFLLTINKAKGKQVVEEQGIVKAINEKKRTADFVATREVKDRQGDIVKVSGIDTTNFERNPVILFGHDYSSLPVGRAINIKKSPTELNITVEFATAEMNPFAEQVWQMVKGGFLNAVSIGFIPHKMSYDETMSANVLEKSELLETSIVPVPANQEALRKTLTKGFEAFMKKDIEENKEEVEEGEKKDPCLCEEQPKQEESEEEIKEKVAKQNKEALQNYRKHQVELRELLEKEATEDEIETTNIVFNSVKEIISFAQKQLKTSTPNEESDTSEKPEPQETPEEGFEKALKEILGVK